MSSLFPSTYFQIKVSAATNVLLLLSYSQKRSQLIPTFSFLSLLMRNEQSSPACVSEVTGNVLYDPSASFTRNKDFLMGSSPSPAKGDEEEGPEEGLDEEKGLEDEEEGMGEGVDEEEGEEEEEEMSEEGLLMTWRSWEEVAETEMGGGVLISSEGRIEGSEDRRFPSLLQSRALFDLFLTNSGV